MSKTYKLNKADSVLVVVDVQDRLLTAIHEWPAVFAGVSNMVKYAQILGVPVIVTEQYPRGLGPTNPELVKLFSVFQPIEKTVFSCFGAPGFEEKINEIGAKSIVLVGIEAHICVTQTALDALSRGFNVHVISDAVGSRVLTNKQIGLNKMQQAGAVISASEIALYEWLERSDCKEFKNILPLIK